ncbi:hypothetical protein KR50_02260 [Jeotgalibacillus campisalis]|uniref:Uncharacterized protein n=1 Tax=Jeotgalibacillus campisalis TaxID=220754 RepID=A0A0C2VVG1_9BACL|nr:hypothetical protein KR50_02260 [Jeotgalibacillus campisalis]
MSLFRAGPGKAQATVPAESVRLKRSEPVKELETHLSQAYSNF